MRGEGRVECAGEVGVELPPGAEEDEEAKERFVVVPPAYVA